jgi:hypothetical protein
MLEEHNDQPKHLALRGIMAPIFIALSLGTATLDLRLDNPVFVWLSLIFCALALAFSREAGSLLASTFKD